MSAYTEPAEVPNQVKRVWELACGVFIAGYNWEKRELAGVQQNEDL